ncbi:MAG: YggS family pyridoxal phosphate-dependent enzyme [Coriobacteriia bacterium]|jgi:pyridoxal phosphate enzyme (YggS family)|nr:YggS family pyridoxal phosphate-dependent enzyme [Coriobacteriia bacterium]
MSAIAERYDAVRRQVADAADACGRDPQDITIVAVTKTVGVDAIHDALAAGIVDFGENRVQEFTAKWGLFPRARWHFIGTLQTNKVKDVVGKAHLIHSVDSLRLLSRIERRAAEQGVIQPVLLQVNVSGEEEKHGLSPDDLSETLAEAADMDSVEVRGLMTMAPLARAEDVRWVFRELRELRDSLRATLADGVELEHLSMGMSGDFRVAVEEGATIVRIGRALFGR